MTWHSARGPIAVHDMDDRHLINTILLLQRKAFQERSNSIVGALIVHYGNPEDFIEASVEDFTPRICATMIKEAYSRGLMIPILDEPVSPGEMLMEELWELEEDNEMAMAT